MVEIFILSFVQGVTEFLPISSSSHIILFSKFMNFISEDLILNVSLHIGSFLAVLVFFRKEILNFFVYRKIFILIIIASLPIILCGYLIAQSGLINDLRSLKIIGWTTVLFAILLYISDKKESEKNLEINLDIKAALVIGILHVFSLIPGVSRSGIAITAARFLKFDRVNAAKISFLLSIPTLLAVSVFGIYNIYITESFEMIKINFSSIILSFIFSYMTMLAFLGYIKKASMDVFVLYRIVLGILILIFAYQG
jgi:undecaprenyl-diphosphatase|tara:strand:+ start:160 stop:921 length:762 start_codon:yes stop_codon:yes gene_type:complete